ncbi:hypothetical protein FDG2_0450 [Candidatus Protofrankia californiensis]|uniref:Uncharacterized protein n=1 Tax=Candidatus Protofrankia californiensis TaxID=1839754 RepID=A0A1C3NTK7_9ACTN|nr:hypothetical protein FDG2_0450 [Candidatus Protofrankia californiensis]
MFESVHLPGSGGAGSAPAPFRHFGHPVKNLELICGTARSVDECVAILECPPSVGNSDQTLASQQAPLRSYRCGTSGSLMTLDGPMTHEPRHERLCGELTSRLSPGDLQRAPTKDGHHRRRPRARSAGARRFPHSPTGESSDRSAGCHAVCIAIGCAAARRGSGGAARGPEPPSGVRRPRQLGIDGPLVTMAHAKYVPKLDRWPSATRQTPWSDSV